MSVGLVQAVIDFLEVLPRDHALAPNLERLLGGDGQRHIEECAHRVGHVLADDTLPTPGDGLLELAVVIAQHQGQAVHFP